MFDITTFFPALARDIILLQVKIILLIGAMFISLRLGKPKAGWRHLSWFILFVFILLLPGLNVITPQWSLPIFTLPPSESQRSSEPALHIERAGIPTSPSVVKTAERTTPDQQPQSAWQRHIPVSSLFWLLVWTTGFFACHVRFAAGRYRLAKIIRFSRVATDKSTNVLRQKITKRFNLSSKIDILISNRINIPIVFGFFRHKIILPTDYIDWSPDHLKYVLLHEVAHIKRHDMLSQLVVQLITSFYWFNPFLWLAHKQCVIERERACDELVLSHTKNPGDYADMLLRFARTSLAMPKCAHAGLAMARASQLEGRLLAILNSTSRRVQNSKGNVLKTVLISAVLFSPILSLSPLVVTADTENIDTTHTALVIESLKYALKDEKGDVREQAVKTLGKINSEKATQLLIRVLQESHDWEVEVNAAKILLSRGETGALDKFISGLSSDNPDVRARSAKILKELKHPASLKPLIKAMQDENTEVAEKVVSAICELRVREAITPLSTALQNESPDIRRLAAWGLGEIKDPKVLPALYAVLNDPDAKVRCNAIESIGDLGQSESADHIDKMLNDSEWFVRREAIKVLAEIHALQSAPKIIDALHDDHRKVREAAAEALGELGDRRAIVPLSAALHDNSDDVREAAADALGQFYKE